MRSATARRAGAHAFALTFVLFLAGCDSPEERAQKHYLRGQTLIEQNEVAKARLEFRNAVRLDRRHAGARFAMGELAQRDGQLRNALGNFQQAAEADPTHLQARIKLAELNLAGGVLDDARRYADEAAALAPGDANVLAVQGAILYRSGDTATGLAKAAQAIGIDDRTVTAHALLVGDMLLGGRAAEALAHVDAVLGRQPREEGLHALKLRVLATMQDAEGSLLQLAKMADMFPEQTRYRLALADAYARSGRLVDAETHLRSFLARDPTNSEASLGLVQVVYAQRGEAAAIDELVRMIAALPPTEVSLPMRFALADLHRRAGRIEEQAKVLRDSEAAMTRPGPKDRVRVQMARLELSRDNRAEAKRLVDAVLERDGNNADALAIRASIEIDEYRPEDAILTLRRALSAEPQNAQLMLLEARAHERNGNPVLARERLAAATRASDFAPDMAIRYAGLLRNGNETAAAETILEEAVRRHPADRTLLTALAEVRILLGDLVGADAVAMQLRALENGGAIADRIAAATLIQRGQVDEGIGILERTLDNPEAAQNALAALVSSYVRSNQRPRAVELLDRLIAENPANVRALVLRAELHLLENDSATAERLLRQAVQRAPEDPVSHLVLARFLVQRGDPTQGEAVLRNGITSLPRNEPLQLQLAELLERRGAMVEALEVYRQLYELNPESIIVSNNYASLLAEFHEDDAEAIAKATRIARRLRGSRVPHFQDTYAWITFLSGNSEEALRLLTEAAEALPGNPLVRYHFGRVLASVGDESRARTELEAALAIDPSFPKSQSARGILATLRPSNG